MSEIRVPSFTSVISGNTVTPDIDLGRVEEIYAGYNKKALLQYPPRSTQEINGGSIDFYDVMPRGDIDDLFVGVRFLEAGNDMAPHQYASALLIAEYFNMRVIVVPYNRYSLKKSERAAAFAGDLGSIARRLSVVIDTVTSDDQIIHTDGASLGAQLALPTTAEIAKIRPVGTAVALENPNSRFDASMASTAIAFSKAGNDAWKAAERDASWDGLSELSNEKAYVNQSNIDFFTNFLNRDTAMWLGAMSRNSLGNDLRALGNAMQPGGAVVVARDEQSAMTSESGFVEAYLTANRAFNTQSLSMVNIHPLLEQEARGHAITNNPLARLALLAHGIHSQK